MIVTSAAPLVESRIGGANPRRRGQATFEDRDPARPDEVVATVASAGTDDVADAVTAAADAAGAWAATSPIARSEVLLAAARHMRADAEEIAQLATREMGKPIVESRGEVGAAVGFLEYFAGEAVRLAGDVLGSARDRVNLISLHEPLGVLGLITPWNFPMSIPTKKTSVALACGNAVVLKPASRSPAVAARIIQLLVEAGLPEGTVNLVVGSGEEAGAALVADQRVAAISFTGSTEVGWPAVAVASARRAAIQAEMGGKNGVVVWDDCDLERAVRLIVDGAYRSAGQKCTATSRVIVRRSIEGRFTDALLGAVEAIRVGDPRDPQTFMGPLVDEAQLERVDRYVAIGRREGATLLAGGERLRPAGVEDGYFYAPTVFADVDRDMTIAREEIFGPVLALMTCTDFDEAIELTNATDYGLAAVIHTSSLTLAADFVRRADVGCAGVNVTTAGWEAQAPFGGTKASGYGIREQGAGAIDFFTRRKTVATLA